jgi:hypothetical protein
MNRTIPVVAFVVVLTGTFVSVIPTTYAWSASSTSLSTTLSFSTVSPLMTTRRRVLRSSQALQYRSLSMASRNARLSSHSQPSFGLCRSSLPERSRIAVTRLFGDSVGSHHHNKDTNNNDDKRHCCDNETVIGTTRLRELVVDGNVVESILASVTQQVESSRSATVQQHDSPPTPKTNDDLVKDMLASTLQRVYSTTRTVSAALSTESMEPSSSNNKNHNSTSTYAPQGPSAPQSPSPQQAQQQQESTVSYSFPLATRYKNHPAISNVALAHALWATILRPNVDSVIDATCGNGYDSLKLAQLLFPTIPQTPQQQQLPSSEINNNNHVVPINHSQLWCLDIQAQACQRTQQVLNDYFQSDPHLVSYQPCAHVVQASHQTLPRPTNQNNNNTTTPSVGLVVYNLGWLPNTVNSGGKDCVTTMETTIASLADAALLVRVGGMISVVTYPATGPEEDVAVRLFLECLALLSSNTRSWQSAIATKTTTTTTPALSSVIDHSTLSDRDENNNNNNNDRSSHSSMEHIAHHVTTAMNRVIHEGCPGQTWRVSQHEKLGMDNAPILITATRLK